MVLDQFNQRTAENHIFNCCNFFLHPEKFFNDAMIEFNLAQGKHEFVNDLIEAQEFVGHTLPLADYFSADLQILKQSSFLQKDNSENMFFEYLRHSHLNPPGNLELVYGELFYLDLLTIEGKALVLTVSKNGIFVNNHVEAGLPDSMLCNSIIELLKKVSPKAQAQLNAFFNIDNPELVEKKLRVRNIFEGPIDPTVGWCRENNPKSERQRSIEQLQKIMGLRYGGKFDRTYRDWNEEFQNYKAIQAKDTGQVLNKAKYLRKFLEEFSANAVEIAKQIVN